MSSVGNREFGVLEYGSVIRHMAQMIQVDLRQSLFLLTKRVQCREIARARMLRLGLRKQSQITAAHFFHYHRPRIVIGGSAQLKALLRKVQELINLLRQSFGVFEGYEPAAPIGQHLLCMPIGGGHDGLARTHRIGQCAGHNLSLVKIWGNVDIGSSNDLKQFIALQEPVMKHNVVADAQFLCLMMQTQAVVFVTFGPAMRMSGANHVIEHLRM